MTVKHLKQGKKVLYIIYSSTIRLEVMFEEDSIKPSTTIRHGDGKIMLWAASQSDFLRDL